MVGGSYELVTTDVEEGGGDIELQDLVLEEEENEGKVEIKVLNVGSQTTKSVYVFAEDDVRRLMGLIAEAFEGAPVERQRLIAAGRVLRPDESLKEHRLDGGGHTIHLSVRPADMEASSGEEATVNPLATASAVDALSAALALDGTPVVQARTQTSSDSALRAAARVRLLSSLLALYCALNSLTALVDTTNPSNREPDEHAVVELALNVGGLWVGAAGLKASRYLDVASADRYDRALRVFAISTLSYEAYYRLVYLPSSVADTDDDDDAPSAADARNASTSGDNDHSHYDDYAGSRFGDDDLGAGTKSTRHDNDEPSVTRNSQMVSGFVTLTLMASIWLVCVQNSARLRAELRGLADPSQEPFPGFATATLVSASLVRDLKRAYFPPTQD